MSSLARVGALIAAGTLVSTGLVSGLSAPVAAISNDPLGDLDPACTFAVNHAATMRLATLAKAAGVGRFVLSSTCSLYGAHGGEAVDERAELRPVTPYAESKQRCEEGLRALADDDFSPTYLRSATAYGVSPRLRGDLVVNNLTGLAFATGEVLLRSDGTPWRPLVHVRDVAAATAVLLEAPEELVSGEAFNIGSAEQNYRISDLADQAPPTAVVARREPVTPPLAQLGLVAIPT